MSDLPAKTNDTEFLISRSLDEALPKAEHARLAQALDASPDLRAEANRFRALDGLLKRWATGVDLDWDIHQRLITAQISDNNSDEADARVDALLQRWGTASVPPADDGLVASVLLRIRRDDKRRLAQTTKRLYRIGVPLAAAAALLFAVTATLRRAPEPESVVQYRRGPTVSVVTSARVQPGGGTSAQVDEPSAAIRTATRQAIVTVVFARTTSPGASGRAAPSISFGTVGAEPVFGAEDEPDAAAPL